MFHLDPEKRIGVAEVRARRACRGSGEGQKGVRSGSGGGQHVPPRHGEAHQRRRGRSYILLFMTVRAA
eukprot:2237507-Pyramimonas_sp.AAC.1